MPRQLSLLVKGVDHANRKPKTRGRIPRRFEIAASLPGEPVDLVPEPDNPADPNAIMIFSARGIQLGYVAAERAPYIGGHIRRGEDVRAIFQEATRHGAIIRVSLDGSEPVLPERSAQETSPPSEDEGYFVDPVWPDD
ncbi:MULTISPECIES: HIRAN domain-containing protein [unclassified Sphingomonas]|uniref:HIRAN domain-containing protein n=1 Tax=unclassified Sphingomonas TaxID=196159 RepID=UPI0006F87AE0|nr:MULTISPECIES: HIRAN domain-containing protein [unclassified Sphingomonas]KQX19054.1 hypothetical protein ASD17_10805 [Sphingomonas sp. Root1294]KQY65255.1 hypothetical protein ASD39_14000 [Sphingomonas sp. Root50]KRB95451.1 hypothetical protein ASE22_06055 [Sphingomonas sp. Root720]